MKRIKRVIKNGGGQYLCYFRLNEYQEPVFSFDTDVFEALDFNRYHMDFEKIWQTFIIGGNCLIEDYELTAVRK